MRVIAFGHRRRVGKDQCAKFLMNYLRMETSLKVQRGSFAYKLKQMAFDLYSWAGLREPEYYEDEGADEKEEILAKLGKSPRQVWIEMGMKFREIYSHTWVDYLFFARSAEVLIIPDLRFRNEAERVRDLGGTLVKVVRPGIEEYDDPADTGLKDFDDWDVTLQNDGDLNDLYNKVTDLANDYILADQK